jgi:hypothetical protein
VLQSGPVLFAVFLGVVLTSAASWAVAGLYRRRMVRLMRGGCPPDLDAQKVVEPLVPEGPHSPVRMELAANQRASLRLLLALAILSLLIGLTQSLLEQVFIFANLEFSLNRVLVLGAAHAWPMVLAWGLARRWSWWRVLLGVAIYMGLVAFLVMWRSNEQQTLALVGTWLAGQVAIPMLVTLFIGASGRIRAVAPYLLPPFLLLSASSVIALDILGESVKAPPDWIIFLIMHLGPTLTIVLLALSPWVLMAWPVYALGRSLAEAYRVKRFSDLAYLFGVYWFVVLFTSILPALQETGWVALIQLLSWFWIPLAGYWLKDWLAPRGNPPTLLVLRVFQRDAQVEKLFDRVIERWRLTGNTVLIAGTDLVSRTLDPDELFAYFNGRLAERFVAAPDEIRKRLAELDMAPDPDGRYRVNECYCFDTTWQAVLAALVKKADVVLMDLRGFREKNAGCLHELGVLAQAPHLQRVVLLHDRDTERPVAEAAIAGAPVGRFQWLEASHMNQAMIRHVLAAMFPPPGSRDGPSLAPG